MHASYRVAKLVELAMATALNIPAEMPIRCVSRLPSPGLSNRGSWFAVLCAVSKGAESEQSQSQGGDALQQQRRSNGKEKHAMDHADLVARMAMFLGELMEAGTKPEALPQEAVHTSHLGLESIEEVLQERLKPWRRCCLAADIVHAVDPWICDVPKEKDGGLI